MILKMLLFPRIFNFSNVRPRYILIACLLMPASILLAQGVSLLLGHSVDQFTLSIATSFSYSIFPAWFMLFLAPVLEELAWHSYGTDCLRAKFNLFTTSLIFGLFWVFWHFPRSFIKDYYHSNLVETGWVYTSNFAVSIFPFVIIINWLYYKTNRNITVTIIFHITAGLFNEMFSTHPDSKVIQTVLLLILASFLIFHDRDFFFRRKFHDIK